MQRPLTVFLVAAMLAALVVPGALVFAAALLLLAAVLPLAPLVALRRPRVETQAAPRFLRSAAALLRAPPTRPA